MSAKEPTAPDRRKIHRRRSLPRVARGPWSVGKHCSAGASPFDLSQERTAAVLHNLAAAELPPVARGASAAPGPPLS